MSNLSPDVKEDWYQVNELIPGVNKDLHQVSILLLDMKEVWHWVNKLIPGVKKNGDLASN